MTRFLYLSPHLDDVVLSAGATVARRLAEGHELIVTTIFSGPENGADEEESRVYARRRNEDERALAILREVHGHRARSIYLGLSDAPYRDAYYSAFEPIVHGSSTRPSNQRTRQELATRLRELLETERPEVLVAPFAVGTHVDHRLVFETVTALHWEGETRFYEELPYAFVPGAVEQRWNQLGAEALSVAAAPPASDWPALGFLEGYRDIPTPQRQVSAWRWKRRDYARNHRPSSPQERETRARAIAAYGSQMGPLFDAEADDGAAVIANLYGNRAEIEWCPVEDRAAEGSQRGSVVESSTEES